MRHTQHHIKWFHEGFWREIVDKFARGGTFSVTRTAGGGIEEIRPRRGTEIRLTFGLPAGYTGEAADFTGHAWLVTGNLMALFGCDGNPLKFEAGQAAIELTNNVCDLRLWGKTASSIPSRRFMLTARYKTNGGIFGYYMNSATGANLWQRTQLTGVVDEEKTTELQTNTAGMMHTLRIVRGDTAEEMYISAPILAHGHDFDNDPPNTARGGRLTPITWTGDNPEVTLTANSELSQWIVLEPYRENVWPPCTIEYMRDVESRFTGTWERIKAVYDEIIEKLAGKVDKETGKGLSTNDYTTEEKTKLAGIEAGANAYVLPAATKSVMGGVAVTHDQTDNVDYSHIQAETEMFNQGFKKEIRALLPYATSKPGGYGVVKAGEGLQMPYDGTIDMKEMTGATAERAGSIGAPPVPQAGDQGKYLRGDGTWVDRTAIYEPALPTVTTPVDTMGMVRSGENDIMIFDAQAGTQPSIYVFLDGESHDTVTVRFYYYSTTYVTCTLDFLAKTGAPVTQTVVMIADGQHVSVGANPFMLTRVPELDLETPLTIPQQSIVLGTDVGTVGIVYRQNLAARLKQIEDRITALESA